MLHWRPVNTGASVVYDFGLTLFEQQSVSSEGLCRTTGNLRR
jgi:hypothetical protein